MKFTKTITHTIELNAEEMDNLIERYDLAENYDEDTPKTQMIEDLLDELLPWDLLELMDSGIKCDYDTYMDVEGVED